MFVPTEKGSPSYGGTDENGVYQLMFNHQRAGAMLGKHHVIIESPEPETDDAGNRILSAVYVEVPRRYSQPGLLTAEVSAGKNELNFTLEPDASDTQSPRPGQLTTLEDR